MAGGRLRLDAELAALLAKGDECDTAVDAMLVYVPASRRASRSVAGGRLRLDAELAALLAKGDECDTAVDAMLVYIPVISEG